MGKTAQEKTNKVKLYGVIIGIVALVLQHTLYMGGNELAKLVGNTPILLKIPAIDDAIPIIPIFLIIYVWSYFFWAMAPMAASKCEYGHFLDSMAGYLFPCLFGFLILIFVPTYMDRVAEGLFDTSRQGLFADLLRSWYGLDGGEMAYNMFPSFHCLNSTVSYMMVAGRKEIPKWFRVYSCVMMLLIYLTTLFVKQHYVPDVLAGSFIGFVGFALCKKYHAGRVFLGPIRFFKKLFKKA